MQTQTENSVRYAIIKDRSSQFMRGAVINPTVEIHTFKNGSYSDFRPALDTLLKDFEIFKEDGKPLIVRGTKVDFWYSSDNWPYDKRWRIVEKKNAYHTVTKEDAAAILKLQSDNSIEPKLEDIKLGHFGFWDWLRNKKSYYVDTTKEIVSHFYKVDPEYLIEVKGQIHRKAGWSRMLLTQPFQMEATHYRIYEN